MNDPTTGLTAAERALDIATSIEGFGGDNIHDLRTVIQDLLGHPLSRDARRELTAVTYHLDGLELACQRLILEIRTDHA